MSAIDDLIAQVQDEALRERLAAEAAKLVDAKKFGLVFEEHIPECAPLYDVPIKVGSNVALKGGAIAEVYTALKIEGDTVLCAGRDEETKAFNIDDLVAVAEFGEPIYPALEPLDAVQNGESCGPWHALIEAENYHALQLLEYTCAGQVDCIYIDPPYNTGNKDWKYNNDYVDGADAYRHSKWLSMMKKRLLLAKKLLNPQDSVLIVTIDEKEYLHLGCLLEELFPEAKNDKNDPNAKNVKMQMVTTVIKPSGNRRDNEFSRCEEYIYFIYFGKASLTSNGLDMLREIDDEDDKSIRLKQLLRGPSNNGRRVDRPNLFYPLLFERDTGKFVGPGPVLAITEDKDRYVPPEGTVAMWPIGANGTEATWNLQPSTLMEKHRQHFLSFGKWDGKKRTPYYLSEGQEKNFKNGLYNILGQDDDGAYIIELKSAKDKDVRPMTVWNRKSHSASEFGTTFLNGIFHDRRFPYPKSLYAVHDAIRFFTANKPQALILDFFAGSATTLHAVNLLNAEDGGKRRCILVTNNEVSAEEAQRLGKQGLNPGDAAWEAMGIARYVAWPRTVCSIKGQDVAGAPLKGSYLGSERPMSAGFEANAAFFKLTFVDKTSVSLGRQFKALLPLLWMKAGCVGSCPALEGEDVPQMLVLPQNVMAVLVDEGAWPAFDEQVREDAQIATVFIVTDSEASFRSMVADYDGKRCFQLYRDYLENFKLVSG